MHQKGNTENKIVSFLIDFVLGNWGFESNYRHHVILEKSSS